MSGSLTSAVVRPPDKIFRGISGGRTLIGRAEVEAKRDIEAVVEVVGDAPAVPID
jgi:hypothetical protein